MKKKLAEIVMNYKQIEECYCESFVHSQFDTVSWRTIWFAYCHDGKQTKCYADVVCVKNVLRGAHRLSGYKSSMVNKIHSVLVKLSADLKELQQHLLELEKLLITLTRYNNNIDVAEVYDGEKYKPFTLAEIVEGPTRLLVVRNLIKVTGKIFLTR